MILPFKQGLLQHNACPIQDVLSELTTQLKELQQYKAAAEAKTGAA